MRKVFDAKINETTTLRIYEDLESDNRKWFHFVTIDNVEYNIDWSPYTMMSIEDVNKWIEAGKPSRISNGPLHREDLDSILSQI